MAEFTMSLAVAGSRITVSFAICWLIITDASGYGKPVHKFLRRDVFNRFGKITFAYYLILPYVTALVTGSMSKGLDCDFVEIVSTGHNQSFLY